MGLLNLCDRPGNECLYRARWWLRDQGAILLSSAGCNGWRTWRGGPAPSCRAREVGELAQTPPAFWSQCWRRKPSFASRNFCSPTSSFASIDSLAHIQV